MDFLPPNGRKVKALKVLMNDWMPVVFLKCLLRDCLRNMIENWFYNQRLIDRLEIGKNLFLVAASCVGHVREKRYQRCHRLHLLFKFYFQFKCCLSCDVCSYLLSCTLWVFGYILLICFRCLPVLKGNRG